jgi:hypothetical protein
MPEGLGKALTSSKRNADSDQLLKDLIEVWGGTRQLAFDLFNEFQNAPMGGMSRQRILEMVQRLIINNTNHDIGKIDKPSDMSDEDLDRIALEYMGKVTNANPVG